MSQYFLSITLIFLAWGWTINVNSLEEFDLFLPICIMLAVFQIIIIALGRLADNEENFMHRYDNFVGWLIVVFTIGLYLVFMYGITETMAKITDFKVKKFMTEVAINGTLYFFAFPFLMVVSVFFVPWDWRSLIVEVGRVVSQSIGILWMARVSTNERGQYKKVSEFDMQ